MIRRFFHFSGQLIFFGTPVLAVLFGIFLISLAPIFGLLDPSSIDRATLIRVMQLRDFRPMTPQQVAALADRAEAEFGRRGTMRPGFDFTPSEKKLYGWFQKRRSASEGRSGSSLVHMENNIVLMARSRYFRWMNEYETLSEPERAVLMREVTADMKYWESIYKDFLRAAELPIPSLAELIREFDRMTESFKIDATPEEVVRIDTFKQRMNAAIVAGEMRGAVKNLSGSVGAAVTGVLGTFLPMPKRSTRKELKVKDENEQTIPSEPRP